MWEGAFLESMAKAGWSATALERQVENGKVTGNSGGTSYQTIIARAVEKCVIPPFLSRIRWEHFWPRDLSARQKFPRW